MKERLKAYSLQCLRGERRGLGARLWLAFLTPLSFAYSGGVVLRLGLYRRGWLPRRRLPCRVISVGNLVAGGTGKTPLVEVLARAMHRQGRRVVILLRGYRGRAEGPPTLVSDGSRIQGRPPWVGDEAYLLARNLSGVPVIMGADRYQAGCFAVEEFGAEDVLLDDGFQHLALYRDLDILLIDGANPFGYGYLLPRGTLREPMTSIGRAQVLIVTRADLAGETGFLKQHLRSLNREAPILLACHQPHGLQAVGGEETMGVEALQGTAAMAFSGIADPASFEATLTRLGTKILKHLAFPDHYCFTQKDIEAILEMGRDLKAEMILTTEKDAVRIPDFSMDQGIPIYALKIEFAFLEGQEALEQLLGLTL